jgi:hypothetical protein
MLFKASFHAGIVDGSITRTFRRWKRLQVVRGNRYRQSFGEIEVTAAVETNVGSITERDAKAAGYDSRKDLFMELDKYTDGILYRIDFRFAGADRRIALREKDDLSGAEIDALVKRLDRLDKERPALKLNIRKLKESGLTESLEVGYCLSPRGKRLLDHLRTTRKSK